MSNPNRLPARRPLSAAPAAQPRIIPSRRLTRAEQAACEDVVLHEVDMWARLAKATLEGESNRRLMEAVAGAEIGLYDELLPRVGTSDVKQRMLVRRLADLAVLDTETIERYRGC